LFFCQREGGHEGAGVAYQVEAYGSGGFAAGKLGRNNSLDAGLAALDAALASNAEV
jgi:hypothetical protein